MPVWGDDISTGWLVALGTAVTAVGAALAALIAKVWPLLMESKAQAAKLRREEEETKARLATQAHDQAMQAMADVLKALREERDRDNARHRDEKAEAERRFEVLFKEVREAQKSHADCLARTERQEAALRILKARLDDFQVRDEIQGVATTQDALVVVDARRKITEWNPAATMLTHYRSKEAVGMTFDQLVPEKDLAACDAGFASCIAEGRPPRRGPYLVEVRTKEGKPVPVEMVLSSWTDEAGARFFAASLKKRVVLPGGADPLDEIESVDPALPEEG